jgi:hypothetical protein
MLINQCKQKEPSNKNNHPIKITIQNKITIQ